MNAELFLFRAFESARDQARRAGLDPKRAIAEVREAQRSGSEGHHVAGKYRALASRPRFNPPPRGDAA